MASDRLTEIWKRILQEPQEASNLDFKESVPWDATHRDELVKDLLGMANHRDGGIVIVGIAEDKVAKLFVFKGILPEHLPSFVDDIIKEYTASFADPGIALEISRIPHEGKTYVAIEVSQFREVPVVCRKHAKVGEQVVLREGAIYYRTSENKPQTREARAEDMRHLLDLSFQMKLNNNVRPILEALGAINQPPQPSAAEKYDSERGDF